MERKYPIERRINPNTKERNRSRIIELSEVGSYTARGKPLVGTRKDSEVVHTYDKLSHFMLFNWRDVFLSHSPIST